MTTSQIHFEVQGRRSGVAVWRHIADTLAGEIRNRDYAATGKLPSEGDLAERFAVNRHTLRQAVGSLQTEGWCAWSRGAACSYNELLNYALSRRTRFSENLQRQGLLPDKQLVAARSIAPPRCPAKEYARCKRHTPMTRPLLCIESIDVDMAGHPIEVRGDSVLRRPRATGGGDGTPNDEALRDLLRSRPGHGLVALWRALAGPRRVERYGARTVQPQLAAGAFERITGEPRRYGFHATLKAPFRLQDGATEANPAGACRPARAQHEPGPLAMLVPVLMDGFVALVPARPNRPSTHWPRRA
jgi:DNA-binding transcriptional regulator YhcF (GntR family)